MNILFFLFIFPLIVHSLREEAHVAGDVEIGGLFEIRSNVKGECSTISSGSVQLYEAAKWAVQYVNQQNYLPGFTLGIRALPTCKVEGKAVENVVQLLKETDYESRNTTLVGLIGPEYSSEAENTSQFISNLPRNSQLLQFLFSSTAQSLADRSKYRNIKRVIPSDNIQVQVISSLLRKLEWNYVAVVYEGDTYGVGAFQEFRKLAEDLDICIPYSASLSVGKHGELNPAEITGILGSITRNPESTITGVIVFGSPRVAKSILESAEIMRNEFTFEMAFVFSESVDLNVDAFSNGNEIIQVGRGAFIASPRQFHFPNFTAHWKSIFEEKIPQAALSTNPWLADVYKDFDSCDPSDSIDNCPSTNTGRKRAKYESKYVGFVIQSVLAMAKLLKNVHSEICSSSGLCIEMQNSLQNERGDLIQKANSLTLSLGDEFPDLGVGVNLTFSEAVDVNRNKGIPDYEVFQFRECPLSQSDYCIVQVGSYESPSLHLYNENIRNPVVTAQCNEQKSCLSCMKDHLYDEVYFQDGDLYVVGTAPIYDKVTDDPVRCSTIRERLGVELAEAMAFAVELVNDRKGKYAKYFPGKKIGFVILNPCDQYLRGQNLIMSILQNGVKLRNGTMLKISDKILGFVCGYTSIMSRFTSYILTPFKYVQIAYASLADFLSDRTLYPYFLRTGTPEFKLSNSIIELVKSLNSSNYIQIVHSEGVYGEGGRDNVRDAAKTKRVCIAAEHMVPEGGVYSKILPDLRKTPYAKIVIVILHSFVLLDVLNAVYTDLEPGEFIFISSAAWSNRFELIDSRPKLAGSFSYAMEMVEHPDFRAYVNSRNFTPQSQNPWLQKYVEARYNCYLPMSFEKGGKTPCLNVTLAPPEYKFELWTMFAMNAMLALLGGTNDAYQKLCGSGVVGICEDYKTNPQIVYDNVKVQMNVIDESGTPKRVFDDNGDGMVGAKIYQIQREPDNPGQTTYVQVGTALPGDMGYKVDHEKVIFPYGRPTSVCPNPRACAECFADTDKTDDTPEQSKVKYGEEAVISMGVAIGVLFVVLMILIIVLIWKYRKGTGNKKNDDYIYAINDPFQTNCSMNVEGMTQGTPNMGYELNEQ